MRTLVPAFFLGLVWLAGATTALGAASPGASTGCFIHIAGHPGESLELIGLQFTRSSVVQVDYTIDGTVALPTHRLVVTEDGQLHATVTAASVMVRGQLDGHISTERLEITSSAVVNAGVVAERLALHDGAQFTGPVNTERAKAAGNVARHRQKPQ